MKNIEIIDETFDNNSTNTYELSILLEKDGLSFSVFDTIQKKYIGLKNFPITASLDLIDKVAAIESFLEKEELFKHQYKTVKVIHSNAKQTLIPEALFQKESLKLYLQFNTQIDEYDEIHYYFLKKIAAYSIFTIDNSVSNILLEKFPDLNYLHQSAVQINYFLSESGKAESTVFLNLNYDFIDVCFIKKGKLILYNQYAFQTNNDILLYVANLFKQLRLNQEKQIVYVSGRIQEDSEAFLLLSTYFSGLKLQKPDSSINYTYQLDNIDTSVYFNLLNSHLCEL